MHHGISEYSLKSFQQTEGRRRRHRNLSLHLQCRGAIAKFAGQRVVLRESDISTESVRLRFAGGDW